MSEEQSEKGQEVYPPIQAGPLPIWPILRDAVLIPWDRRGYFGRLMIIPLIATFLFELAWVHYFGDFEASIIKNSKLYFLLYIPLILFLTVYAVACHRSILVGEYKVPKYGIGRWTYRETLFLLWPIFIGILAIALTILCIFLLAFWALLVSGILLIVSSFTGITFAIWDYFPISWLYLLLLLFCYFWGRFSLILPATAIDLDPTPNLAWNQSIGNGFRVAFVACILPWTSSFLLNEFSFGYGGEEGVILILIRNFFLFLITTFEITALSLAYMELSWWNGPRLEKRLIES